MRDLILLFVHVMTTVVRLVKPGGVRANILIIVEYGDAEHMGLYPLKSPVSKGL